MPARANCGRCRLGAGTGIASGSRPAAPAAMPAMRKGHCSRVRLELGLNQPGEIANIAQLADLGSGEPDAERLFHRQYDADMREAIPALDLRSEEHTSPV